MHRNPPGTDDDRVDGWTFWQPVFTWGAVGTVIAFIWQFSGPKTGFLDLRVYVAAGASMILVSVLCLWRWIELLANERFAHLWRGHAELASFQSGAELFDFLSSFWLNDRDESLASGYSTICIRPFSTLLTRFGCDWQRTT